MTKSADIRKQLDFPIIDADGHFVEVLPLLHEQVVSFLESWGGASLRDRYLKSGFGATDTATVLMDRTTEGVRRDWRAMPSWWGWQCRNTIDRASCHLPRLLYERLDEMGIDYMLAYPSSTLAYLDVWDPELAQGLARAANTAFAHEFVPYADRITPGGIIPMHTPEIAIAELEYAVNELGIKAVLIAGYARRSIGRIDEEAPKLSKLAYRLDQFGLDSPYDYDPFWQRCIDLGVAPVSHSAMQYHRVERSVSNYVANHIGGLSSCHHGLVKSLFLGGVTARFPKLRIGLLEGGVAFGCSLYNDLLAHWEKRNINAIGDLDPDILDVEGLMRYFEKYGDDNAVAHLDTLRAFYSRPSARPEQLDEFAAAMISSPEELRDRFVPNFYFGCEADDRMIAWAFNEKVNPLGARLRPIFGSDVSHWDVPDFTEPVEEAFELVEDGVITEADFREFAFINPARLHYGMNPRFFEGTSVERQVAAVAGELLS
ncbi:MAG: amidohydrolase family protein [Acidimicrobiales bacterium]